MVSSLFYLLLAVSQTSAVLAQQDSIIYREEPIEESDFKPRLFSWSWRGRDRVTITPENLPTYPRAFTDIYLYFDGKEFDRRIQELEQDLDRIRWYFRMNIQNELNKIKIDTLAHNARRIIIKKPNRKREIIIIPQPPYSKEKHRPKSYSQKQDKQYVEELENKIKQLEKRIQELEKNNIQQNKK